MFSSLLISSTVLFIEIFPSDRNKTLSRRGSIWFIRWVETIIRLSSSKLFKIVSIIAFLAEGSTPEIGSSSKNIWDFLDRA